MTKEQRTEIVQVLLDALTASHKLIGEELTESKESLNIQDEQFCNIRQLLGTATTLIPRLESMLNTARAMIAMAKGTA